MRAARSEKPRATIRQLVRCCALAASMLLIPGAGGCSRPAQPVTVGYIGELTGRTSDLGTAGRDGALLAVEQFNAVEGYSGPQVRMLVGDTGGSAEKARETFLKLVNDGVLGVVGPMTSSSAVALVPLANETGVALVSPTASTDELTGERDSFYRVYPDNRGAAAELARAVKRGLGLSGVSIVYDVDNLAHTGSWEQNFSATFEEQGGTVIGRYEFMSGDVGAYGGIIRRTLRKNPPAVFLLSSALDTALLATELKEQGYSGEIVVSEWAATGELVEYGGRAVEGITFLGTVNPELQDAGHSSFTRGFKTRFGYEPGFASIHAYEAMQVILEGLAQEPSREAVTRSLSAGGPAKTIQGTIVLDRAGDCERPYYLMTIQSGEFRASK
jgi:branched-chain amino acid transport system substrate-binding protein